MLTTSARLLRLLSLLESTRDWTGPQLAERLGVTTRTVRNDIDRLRNLGYPVDATPGVSGGYRLGVGAALPPLLLDDDEAVAVAIGLRGAAAGSVAGIEDSSVRALAKLDRLLPSRLRRRVGTLAAAMVALPAAGPSVDADTLIAIAAACRDHEQVRFDYETHRGHTARRHVEPHRLVNAGKRWYLIGWDADKKDWRTFRVDRMALRTPNGPRFTPRDMPDEEVADRMSRGLATATWHYRASVTVAAPADEIAARLPSAITVEAVDDRTCRIEVGSDTPHMLAVYLGMLDADFSIDTSVSPELVQQLAALSARYARAAEATSPPST